MRSVIDFHQLHDALLADDYYVVYSDLDLGLHHPSLSDLTPSCRLARTMSPPPKPPVPTFADRKRAAQSKVVPAPSPPRRISSKWHPSLIKSNKDQPPVPSARSTSAERVRETRALYSSWHREKVARSREKLGASPARTSSIGRSLSAAKQTQEARENFLKGRRTVSESRFTIEDRENSPPRRSPSSSKPTSPTRQSEIREKLQSRSPQRDGLYDKVWASKHEVQDHASIPSRGHNRSLSADSTRKWSNTSAESGRCSVMRHTVSSMNKIKRPSLQHNQTESVCPGPRSSSAESNYRRRRSGCLSPEPQISSRKSPVSRKDSRYRGSPYSDVSTEVSDDKKLKQSESFDTTQSNETGYSSMLDLSTSPTPEKKMPEDRERQQRKASETQSRPHSTPVRRSRISTSFHDQRNKWEALTRGESVGGRQSRTPSRSTSPLRSLQLVRQVSSSFRDIPVEVWSAGSRRSRSLDVLTPSPHSHPHRYRQYILELRNAAPRNARISQLRRLFTSLDRVHRLERSVSSVELSAAQNRAYEIIDFETWKGMREKERKALEYSVLLKELNVAQKEREFLYKVTPDRKWSGDCRLRGRDVSVPELCEKFSTTSDNTSEITQKRRRELDNNKDTYRGLWRGSSVRDLSQMYQSPERHRSSSRRGSSLSLSREDSSMRARGLWTSLSLEQVNAFRDHLTEIYGSMQSIRSWRERKQMSSERAQTRSQRELSKYNVDVAETGRALADKLRTLHVRPPAEPSQRSHTRTVSPPRPKKASSLNQIEDERRQLSKQLSIELQEKVLEQRSGRGLQTASRALDSLQVPDVSLSVSPESLSRSSPRTCYSLDISDSSEPNSLNSGDQFLLVVQKPGRSGRSQSLPPEPVSDPETSDSEVSVRTVVHKDVAGKVKFFEKRARRNSRSSERHSSRGSRLNIDEVPHYATLPSRLKQQSQSKLLSPNYLPERSVSSVNLTSKADVASQVWKIYDKTNPLSGSSVQRLADPSRERKDGDPTSRSRSYLHHVKTGDVSRLRSRYESPEEARRRAKSLPDVNGPLSRVTPTGKTFVRGQEAGDVQYMRAKYETPRRSRSPERWQPTRDEYLPKSKLTSTLQSLAARSPVFSEPNTIERLARRDSVEKAVLRRVYTGNVEASVDRLENKRFDSGSGLSLIGQMYTSAPSVNELATMAPLVPPRPPPPLMGPQKPQRLARSNPQPLLTSTPTPSPGDARAVHKQRALQVQEPICPPPIAVHPPPGMSATFSRPFTHYNADAHRPKSRYIPPESYGTSTAKSYGEAHGSSWTQSLERPQRVTRAMTHTASSPASQHSTHCYTLRHQVHSRAHHHHHQQQPPPLPKSSPADHHTYAQPYSYSHTCSQPIRPHHHHSHYQSLSQGREQSYSSKAVSWKGARVIYFMA
nr:serine/arginine repetitive matrix protein 2-like [Procambarus clarkii]